MTDNISMVYVDNDYVAWKNIKDIPFSEPDIYIDIMTHNDTKSNT